MLLPSKTSILVMLAFFDMKWWAILARKQFTVGFLIFARYLHPLTVFTAPSTLNLGCVILDGFVKDPHRIGTVLLISMLNFY